MPYPSGSNSQPGPPVSGSASAATRPVHIVTLLGRGCRHDPPEVRALCSLPPSAYTPMLRLLSMFHRGAAPSTWCPAREREAGEYLAEHLLGSRDDERFEQFVNALVSA